MEADKIGRDKKSSYCSDLSGLKVYFSSCKYVLQLLTKQRCIFYLPFWKKNIL